MAHAQQLQQLLTKIEAGVKCGDCELYSAAHNARENHVNTAVRGVRVSIQGVRCIQGVRVTTDYLVLGDPAPGHPRSPLLTSTCYLLLSP